MPVQDDDVTKPLPGQSFQNVTYIGTISCFGNGKTAGIGIETSRNTVRDHGCDQPIDSGCHLPCQCQRRCVVSTVIHNAMGLQSPCWKQHRRDPGGGPTREIPSSSCHSSRAWKMPMAGPGPSHKTTIPPKADSFALLALALTPGLSTLSHRVSTAIVPDSLPTPNPNVHPSSIHTIAATPLGNSIQFRSSRSSLWRRSELGFPELSLIFQWPLLHWDPCV